jgi:hypothetical protein
MKATIERGRVILPKEIFEKGYLPDNGEIEVEAMEGWLKIESRQSSNDAWLNDPIFTIKAEDLGDQDLSGKVDEILYGGSQ